MTAKKRILAFEIGTFFTRYVVFEDGRMGIPGTIATPVDGEEPFYQALAHIVSKQRAPLDGIAISVPGFIDTEKQVAVTAGALSILYGHEIGRKLQGYLDDPIPTWMENDANCAAMAEKLTRRFCADHHRQRCGRCVVPGRQDPPRQGLACRRAGHDDPEL